MNEGASGRHQEPAQGQEPSYSGTGPAPPAAAVS